MAISDDVRDERITVRIPSSLKLALEREAESERRSLGDIIVFMLEERYSKTARKGGK
ncbi:MAG: DNA-binding protein [Myxococcota bacterium]|nr:DNA-binding protein [Myxococcota bacterium]